MPINVASDMPEAQESRMSDLRLARRLRMTIYGIENDNPWHKAL